MMYEYSDNPWDEVEDDVWSWSSVSSMSWTSDDVFVPSWSEKNNNNDYDDSGVTSASSTSSTTISTAHIITTGQKRKVEERPKNQPFLSAQKLTSIASSVLQKTVFSAASAAAASAETGEIGSNTESSSDPKRTKEEKMIIENLLFSIGTKSSHSSNPSKGLLSIPRILKHDIRRQYLSMFANVINSFDVELMFSFLRRYSKPALGMEKLIHDSSSSSASSSSSSPPVASELTLNQCPRLAMKGRDLVSAYWGVMMHFAPDKVIRLQNIQVHSGAAPSYHSISKSRLTCDYTIQGTLLYDVPFDDMIEILGSRFGGDFTFNKHLVDEDPTSARQKYTMSSTEKMMNCKDFDPIQMLTDKKGTLPTLLSSPLSIQVNGKINLYIDEQKRIEKFEMVTVM